jgi:ribosome biogenesis GTPase
VTGIVLCGSRNIFTIKPDKSDKPEGETETVECRIKGKVLKGVETYYNPLAPGDRVLFESDETGHGLILSVENRRNVFTRRNQKELGQNRSAKSQLLAANVDLVLCVTSAASPPFRPRFLDRLLVQADSAGIKPVIICNKCDLDMEEAVENRLADFSRIGYEVLHVSAQSGLGMESLRGITGGRLSVLAGQSGVGKSSLINALTPGLKIRTGIVNEKYDRGNHTTTLASLIALPNQGFIIDTPGVRRFTPDGVSVQNLVLYMREFAPLFGKCTFGLSCTHRSEAGCKIIEAVAAGAISEDRYESFIRLQEELSEISKIR